MLRFALYIIRVHTNSFTELHKPRKRRILIYLCSEEMTVFIFEMFNQERLKEKKHDELISAESLAVGNGTGKI